MASFNRVILMGNLTRDPDVKHFQGTNCVVNFSIGVNKVWFDKQGQKHEKASFPNCVAWGATARFIERYFTKGSPIHVEGELQTRTYQDNKGETRYITEILVSSVAFCGDARRDGAPARGGAPAQSYGARQAAYNEPELPPMPGDNDYAAYEAYTAPLPEGI